MVPRFARAGSERDKGDRYGKLSDPFGHKWSLGTHTRDVTMEEMEEAQKEFMKQMPKSA